MKKLFITLTFALVGIIAATAQVSNKGQKTDGPQMSSHKLTFDYGKIQHLVPATHEFLFTNTGNAPLIINSANSSCGCSVAYFSKEPIMPGKTGVIKVVYNAANIGHFSKSVTVNSNANRSNIVLYIKGNVVEKPAQPAVVNPAN